MWLVAGAWMLLAAVSAFIAIRIKMPAALVEIIVGMLAGNSSRFGPMPGSTSSPASEAFC